MRRRCRSIPIVALRHIAVVFTREVIIRKGAGDVLSIRESQTIGEVGIGRARAAQIRLDVSRGPAGLAERVGALISRDDHTSNRSLSFRARPGGTGPIERQRPIGVDSAATVIVDHGFLQGQCGERIFHTKREARNPDRLAIALAVAIVTPVASRIIYGVCVGDIEGIEQTQIAGNGQRPGGSARTDVTIHSVDIDRLGLLAGSDDV